MFSNCDFDMKTIYKTSIRYDKDSLNVFFKGSVCTDWDNLKNKHVLCCTYLGILYSSVQFNSIQMGFISMTVSRTMLLKNLNKIRPNIWTVHNTPLSDTDISALSLYQLIYRYNYTNEDPRLAPKVISRGRL